METKESKKAIKTYFDMAAGCYCGLLLEKRLAERMAKLLYRQQQEIKELLAANIGETEVSQWTLVYSDEKQTIVKFFNPEATIEEKMRRVELFNKVDLIRKVDEVFMASSMKEAEHNYLEYYDKLEFIRKK